MLSLEYLSCVLMQNARRAAAAALPPLLVPLPPSMAMPSKKQVEKAVDELVGKQQ